MHWMNWPSGGWITMALFWIIIIVGIILIIKWLTAKGFQSPTNISPIDILKQRYARGEITKDEFDQMKKDIQNS